MLIIPINSHFADRRDVNVKAADAPARPDGEIQSPRKPCGYSGLDLTAFHFPKIHQRRKQSQALAASPAVCSLPPSAALPRLQILSPTDRLPAASSF
jgi:hypothetical protein